MEPNAGNDFERLQVSQTNLDRLLEWISRVDNKAAFAFLILSGMAGALAALAPPFASLHGATISVALVALASLGASAVFLLIVAFPRTRARSRSLFYFGTACDYTLAKYIERFRAATPAQLLDDLLEQCHINSKILDRKFTALRRSYFFLYVAAVPWLAGLLIFYTEAL